jgi:hypothetical protein
MRKFVNSKMKFMQMTMRKLLRNWKISQSHVYGELPQYNQIK